MRKVCACTSAVLALTLGAGCAQVDLYEHTDAKPGGTVFGSSPSQRSTASFLGSMSPRGPQWTRFRVIAPPGASVCRITGQSMFAQRGPEPQGKPNDKGEVMLTYDVGANLASFECETPTGVMRRTVGGARYESVSTGYDGKPYDNPVVLVKPPLVHMDPKDPEAEARWAALGLELCSASALNASSDSYIICKPGMLQKLQTADLG